MPIEIKELSFSYDSKPFIDNLDLKINDGEMATAIYANSLMTILFIQMTFSA